MEGLNNGTQNLFPVPDALIFQNGSDDGELFGYNSSASRNSSNSSNHVDWIGNFGGILPTSNVPRRQEKMGEIMKRELKWAFILHAYGFGCLFFILAFYTFFSVLNLRSFISSRPFMSTINGFLCLLGTTRAGSLIIDPYSLSENMPKIIGQILWDMGFPSIISAFCLVQLAFLQLTQLEIGPNGLRRKSCLSLIVTAHFILTIGMDIVVACHENLMIVKQVIQYVFLTWGVFLCCNFLYSGYKVMAMIRNLPGGLKHREFPDPSYKGIMQLAILAPHNNLAGSVTAALLPTLCAPKIHQQDNTSLSTVGFRNDGNSRILESESIPMLEELAGTSGDEKNSFPLTRGSSFQNQTKNTHKFNLKPKLSLRSISDEDVRCDEANQSRNPSPKSMGPRIQAHRLPSFKSNQFDSMGKTNGGSFRSTENFVTTKSIYEFKPKINNQRTSFENENFQFANRKKSKTQENSGTKSSAEKRSASSDRLIPNILISRPDASEDEEKKKGRENSSSLGTVNEMRNGVKETEANCGERKNGSDELVEIHGENSCKNDKYRPASSEIRGRSKSFQEKEFCGSRRGSQILENRRNSCRRENIHRGDSRESDSSSISIEIMKFDASSVASSNARERKESNYSSWKKKNRTNERKEEGEDEKEVEEESSGAQECLPPQPNVADVSLRSVLNHIAYMNRGQQTNAPTEDDLEKVRKSKVEWVLNITYITAMWGLMLCLSNMGRIYSPFGVTENRKTLTSPSFSANSTHTGNDSGTRTEETGSEIFFSPWPWLWFQTFCRALELAMGCAMANITRQPAANYRYPRSLTLRQRNNFYGM